MPYRTMHGSVSQINRRRWRLRPKIMAQSRFDRIIITGCRTKDRDFRDRTAEAKGAVRQKYAQEKIIMNRSMKGGGCGPLDFSAEGINNDMTIGCRGSLESHRRHRTSGLNCFSEDRNLVHKLSGVKTKALYESNIQVGRKTPIARFRSIVAGPGNQSTRPAKTLDDMETRQKWKQAEEQQGVADDSRSRKGKIIMPEDPPVKVWVIEDDSGEDESQGVAKAGKRHHKKPAEEGKVRVKVDQPEAPDMQGRRRGRRNRSQTLDQDHDRAGKRTRGQREKEQAGETSRRGQGKNRRQKETVNHRI